MSALNRQLDYSSVLYAEKTTLNMVLKFTVNVTTSSDICVLEIITSAQDFSRTTLAAFIWTITAWEQTQNGQTGLADRPVFDLHPNCWTVISVFRCVSRGSSSSSSSFAQTLPNLVSWRTLLCSRYCELCNSGMTLVLTSAPCWKNQ